LKFRVRTPLPLDVLLNEKPVGKPTTEKLLAAYLLARMLEPQYFFFFAWCCCTPKGVAMPCPV